MTRDVARILIVEDEILIAMDLEDELADLGFDPVSAVSVAQAQNMLESEAPDFAILDMHLKSETTFEFARHLRARALPFLFLSGNDARSLPDDLSDCEVLSKPVDIERLARTIRDG